MHDRKISKISESSESTKKVKNFINSIEFDYDKFGLPKEEIKKLKNKHEKKQAKNLKTNKQAEFLFDKLYGETKDNMNIKKAAIIYSANSKQSIELELSSNFVYGQQFSSGGDPYCLFICS